MEWVESDFDFVNTTVDGRNPKQPTGIYKNLVKSWVFSTNLNWWMPDFSHQAINRSTIILEQCCQVPRVIGKAGAIIKELRQVGISNSISEIAIGKRTSPLFSSVFF